MINNYFAITETLLSFNIGYIISSFMFFLPMSSKRAFKATLYLNLKAFDSIESIVGPAHTNVYLTFNLVTWFIPRLVQDELNLTKSLLGALMCKQLTRVDFLHLILGFVVYGFIVNCLYLLLNGLWLSFLLLILLLGV